MIKFLLPSLQIKMPPGGHRWQHCCGKEKKGEAGTSIVNGIKGLAKRSIFVLANCRPLHPQIDPFLGHNSSPPGSQDVLAANKHKLGHPGTEA